MQDFKSYAKEKKSKEQTTGANANGFSEEQLKTFNDFVKTYEGASESQLITAILKEAKRRKDAGTLKNEDIDAFCNMIKPMLNSSQVKKLEKVAQKLKNGN